MLDLATASSGKRELAISVAFLFCNAIIIFPEPSQMLALKTCQLIVPLGVMLGGLSLVLYYFIIDKRIGNRDEV
jgi:hypothetical protein